MTKASNFAKSRENRKNHAISDDQILETAPIQVFSDMDMNILLSRNNYPHFRIACLTSRFYKYNWLVNHINQAALLKSSKNASDFLLVDSIVADFLRYPWKKADGLFCITLALRKKPESSQPRIVKKQFLPEGKNINFSNFSTKTG